MWRRSLLSLRTALEDPPGSHAPEQNSMCATWCVSHCTPGWGVCVCSQVLEMELKLGLQSIMADSLISKKKKTKTILRRQIIATVKPKR